MKSKSLWCIYYQSPGKVVDNLLFKKQFCSSLDIACKVAKELISFGNSVSSIERVGCIIDF